MPIGLKRAYDPPAKGDGRRILVDRVWPRGIAKDDLQIDAWLKDLAPSTELRKWFGTTLRNGTSSGSVMPVSWSSVRRRSKTSSRKPALAA
jgi:Protein of unknown function, DUF488